MPFDNVKTRMQSIGNPDRNMLACAGRMLRTEGVLAFWKATTPRLVRLTVSIVLCMGMLCQILTAKLVVKQYNIHCIRQGHKSDGSAQATCDREDDRTDCGIDDLGPS